MPPRRRSRSRSRSRSASRKTCKAHQYKSPTGHCRNYVGTKPVVRRRRSRSRSRSRSTRRR